MTASVLGRPTSSGPATTAAAVTPNNSTDLAFPTRALWIGGAGSGNLKVDMADASAVTFTGVPVGWFPICVTRVYATGTDVTGIIAVA